ncbi:MAG TPA: arylamine N-acetyltransferase [Solirubrobacteraceae bacterium]|nr:arylamine N-acetyltransferase [Solirubrobacteraceae bacterium]
MLDLDAYLARVGLSGRPGLAELHRGHVTTIPFENLDPRRGIPVSLEPEDLERKLVSERRGGYCFEQNLLLKCALEALGADVAMYLARVRMGGVPGSPRPRTHLVLGVTDEGARWHADVGFGNGTLLEPIPFGPGGDHEQAGWRFRVVEDGPELVLQSTTDTGDWIDLYGFVPEPVPLIDVVTSNWYTCTHPRSPFVTGLIVSAQHHDGGRMSLSDWSGALTFTEETPQEASSTTVEPGAAPSLIANRFGLEATLV